MKAIRRNLRVSSKKVNLIAHMVRGKSVDEALVFLSFAPKKSAKALMETIRSAAANAEQNFKQARKDLYVSAIVVNEGSTLKRSRPVSRGRSHPIMKRTSHIPVQLGVKAPTTDKKSPKKVKVAAAAPEAVPAEAKKVSSK